jgi:hypothetical protein
VYGCVSAVQAICMGFAPPALGYIHLATRSYDLGFEAHIASALLAAAAFLALPAYRFSAEIGALPAPPRGAGGAADATAAMARAGLRPNS